MVHVETLELPLQESGRKAKLEPLPSPRCSSRDASNSQCPNVMIKLIMLKSFKLLDTVSYLSKHLELFAF